MEPQKYSVRMANQNNPRHHHYSQINFGDAPQAPNASVHAAASQSLIGFQGQQHRDVPDAFMDLQSRIAAQNREVDQINAKRGTGASSQQQEQSTAAERKRSQTDRSKLAAAAEQQIHKTPDVMRMSMEKPLPKAADPVGLTSESLANLVPKDTAAVGGSKKEQHSGLEPIENYKGKSLEELEAILDAHNAAHASKKAPEPTKVEKMAVPKERRVASSRRQPSVDGKIMGADTGRRNRQSASGVRASNVGAAAKPRTGKAMPGRPPLAAPEGKEKENITGQGGEQRKGYGKVPKYLQKFAKEKEEQMRLKALDEERKQCPPGTRKMPDSERQAMLTELKGTKAQIEMDLEKFPLSMKTVAIQRKKEDLERQLDKVENSIKVFSKETVYVQF